MLQSRYKNYQQIYTDGSKEDSCDSSIINIRKLCSHCIIIEIYTLASIYFILKGDHYALYSAF